MNDHKTLSGFPLSRGFTLVEISIVLVIIGLLIGGILAARSMIETAQINAQVRQLQQLDVATNAFVVKFNALPGDAKLPTAETPLIVTGRPTGNGNGLIEEWSDGEGCSGGARVYTWECANFFVQLSQYGGMKGNHQIGASYGPGNSICGNNKAFPESPLKTTEGGACIYPRQNANKELFWLIRRDQLIDPDQPFTHPHSITVMQAQSIDSKIDDGKAFTGSVAVAASTVSSFVGCQYGGGCNALPTYAAAFYDIDGAAAGFERECTNLSGDYKVNNTSPSGYPEGCDLQIKAGSYR